MWETDPVHQIEWALDVRTCQSEHGTAVRATSASSPSDRNVSSVHQGVAKPWGTSTWAPCGASGSGSGRERLRIAERR